MSAGIVQLGTGRASSPDRAYDLGAMLFFTDRRPTSLWTRPAGYVLGAVGREITR
jgi:hypothetical protein